MQPPDSLERNPDGTPVGYPCCDRVFPEPDPMFRFLDPEEGPSAFWDLPRDERSRRLRLYLLAVASGADPLIAWMAALDFTPDTIQGAHHLIDVENRDDPRLIGLIQRGAHPAGRIVRPAEGLHAGRSNGRRPRVRSTTSRVAARSA